MYGVLVFEAMATFIGQVSVLSLIAIFGAATTAMVICFLMILVPGHVSLDHFTAPNINKSHVKKQPPCAMPQYS